MSQIRTDAPVTWCPGCGNFGILKATEELLSDMQANGFPLEKVVLVSGIGNHAKIVDYVHINSFNALHGRAIPAALAIKAADPELKVICFVGDGDSFAEGLEHLLFAAKRNSDITVVVHNNRTYGLATGQFTPTSQVSYTGVTMPQGAKEKPFNPLELVLAAGATFIARSYPMNQDHFLKVLQAAVQHQGFAIVDVLQVCVTFNNLNEVYNKKVEEVVVSAPDNYQEALAVIKRWDYGSLDQSIPVGVFYQTSRPTIEQQYSRLKREYKTEEDDKRAQLIQQYLVPKS